MNMSKSNPKFKVGDVVTVVKAGMSNSSRILVGQTGTVTNTRYASITLDIEQIAPGHIVAGGLWNNECELSEANDIYTEIEYV